MAEQPEQAEGARQRKTYSERASASLRNARRSAGDALDPEQRADFLLAEASVFVLLDLAAALRGD